MALNYITSDLYTSLLNLSFSFCFPLPLLPTLFRKLCVCACGGEVYVMSPIALYTLFWRQDPSLNLEFTDGLCALTSEPRGPSFFACQLGFTSMLCCAQVLYMDAGDLNSGHHTCTVISPKQPSPHQFCELFLIT